MARTKINSTQMVVTATVSPQSSDGAALGTGSAMWSDLFLASAGVINFNNGDMTMTHGSNLLTISGGNTRVDRLEIDSANDYIDVDTDLKLIAAADIVLDPAGGDVKADGNFLPNSSDGGTLGSASLMWSDAFLASGAVVNFNNGDITLTHSSNALTVAGGTLATAALTTSTITASGIIKTDDTTEATSTTDGSLQTDGGLSVAKSAVIGDDLDLLSDGAIFAMGAGQDVKITHDGGTGATLASAGAFVIDGAAAVTVDSDAALTVGGATIDMDADGGAVAIDGTGGVNLGTATSGVAISIGHSTSETTVNDNLNTTGRILVNDSTDATSATDGSLQTDGGLSVVKDAIIGNDMYLLSDSSVLGLGAGKDATLTHDGTTGVTLAANPITLDSGGALNLDSDTGDIVFKDGGADQLALDLDGTSGEVIMQLKVDSDDFVFKQYDGTEVFRVEDDGGFDIAGGAGSSGVTISAAGQLTADGRIIVDDATEATSTTDGSLQTDGGLSVAKSAVIGDDLDLLSDGAIFAMGAGQDVTITHDGGTGATLASAGAFVIDGAAAVTVDSDAALTIGGASIDMDADGGAVAIDGTGGLNLATATSGVAISIGHSTSETTVNDNLTVTGDLTVNGATTTVSTTNMVVEDKFIELGNGTSGSPSGDAGFVIERGSSDNVALIWDESADEFFLGSGSVTGASSGNLSLTAANLQAASIRGSKLEIDGASDYIDVDTDLKIVAAADIVLSPGGNNVVPDASDGAALGSASLMWSDLFVASGAVINFNNGDVTMTHSSNLLAIAGGNTRVERLEIDSASDYIDMSGSDLHIVAAADVVVTGDLVPAADDTYDLGTTSAAWQDLHLEGDVLLTDAGKMETAAGDLTISSAAADVVLDAAADVVIDAAGGNVEFKDAGTLQLSLDMDGTSGAQILKLGVDSDDLVFQQYDGNEVIRIADDRRLYFYDKGGEYLYGDGDDFYAISGGDIILDPGGNNVLPGSDSADSLGSTAGTSTIADDFASYVVSSGTDYSSTTTMVSFTGISSEMGDVLSGDTITLSDGSNTWTATTAGAASATLTKASGFGSILASTALDSSTSAVSPYGGGWSVALMQAVAGDTLTIGSWSATVASAPSSTSGTIGVSSASGTASPNGGLACTLVGDAIAVTSASGTLDVSAMNGGQTVSVTRATSALAWANLYVDNIDLNGQGSISIGGTGRIDLDADDDTSIRASADDVITFEIGGADELVLDGSSLRPNTSDGLALGDSDQMWSDAFMASGAVINFNNGDVTLTHAANKLSLAGGSLEYSETTNLAIDSNDSTHYFLVLDSDDNLMKREAVNDFVQHITGAASTRGGLLQHQGKLFIQPVTDVFLSGGLTQGLTASLGSAALSGSVMVFLNGMLQTRSGSVSAATFDYRFDSITAPTKVLMSSALDSDDVLTIRYMKK